MTTGKTGNSPGRSPRRSKTAKPVTIDLKAEDVKVDPTKNKDAAKNAAASTASASTRSVPQAGPKRQIPDPVEPGSAHSAPGGSGPIDPETSTAESKTSSASAASASSASTTVGSGGEQSGSSAKAIDNPTSASSNANKQSNGRSSNNAGKTPTGGNGNGSKANKGSRSGALVGGLVGGAVALLAMYGVQYAGLLPTPGGSTAGTETAAVTAEVDQLKTTVDQLSSTVSKLSMGDGGEAPDLSALTGRLDALETAAATGASNGVTSQVLTDIDNQISELSQRVDTLGAETGDAVASEMADLQSSLGGLAQQVAALETKQAELAQSLTARVEKAEKAASGPGKDLAMARAIAVSGLKTAIDRGGPFASELEAFASVSPDDPAISDLRSFAATGVPTNGQLIADFPDAANRMVASMNPVADDAGLVQRLWSSAQTVVKVRKVGDVEGDGTEAIVARMETHLNNGNLDAARAEWAKLPQEAKAAAQDFGKALAARAEIAKLLAAVQIAAPPPTVEDTNQAADSAAPQTAE